MSNWFLLLRSARDALTRLKSYSLLVACYCKIFIYEGRSVSLRKIELLSSKQGSQGRHLQSFRRTRWWTRYLSKLSIAHGSRPEVLTKSRDISICCNHRNYYNDYNDQIITYSRYFYSLWWKDHRICMNIYTVNMREGAEVNIVSSTRDVQFVTFAG